MSRIIITGGSGVVGTEIKKRIPLAVGYQDSVVLAPAVDVTDREGVAKIFASFKPDLVFHLAAKTNVDWCEENEEQCYQVNVEGTKNVVLAAKRLGAKFVYPSTFYVYNTKNADCSRPFDDRIDNPALEKIVGVYSRSKFLGELAVVESGIAEYFVVRLGALFGGGVKDRKFVGKVLDLVRTGSKTLKMVSDRRIQPSSVADTVRNLLKLVETTHYGVYNMVGHGSASYYEYAGEIIKILGVKDVKVIPITSSQFEESAPRAKNLSVINGKLGEIGLDLMRDWRESLCDYVSSLREEVLNERYH